jgi:hypothetical protein
MKNKKAQVHMMETIAVLLIFFVIIIISFSFYIKTTTYRLDQKTTKSQELESIRVSQTISFLPELQCSSKNIVTDNCFDKFKLNAFESLDESNKAMTYYPLLFYSTITIREIFPQTLNWTLYNKTRGSSSYLTSIPVLLYNPLTKKNAFGLLDVRYYTFN